MTQRLRVWIAMGAQAMLVATLLAVSACGGSGGGGSEGTGTTTGGSGAGGTGGGGNGVPGPVEPPAQGTYSFSVTVTGIDVQRPSTGTDVPVGGTEASSGQLTLEY